MFAEKITIPNQEPARNTSEGTDVRNLLIGAATTAFAGLCFTSGNTMVKLLPPGSSYDILLLRSLIQVQHKMSDVVITHSPDKHCSSKCFPILKSSHLLPFQAILLTDATYASPCHPCRQRLLWFGRLENQVS